MPEEGTFHTIKNEDGTTIKIREWTYSDLAIPKKRVEKYNKNGVKIVESWFHDEKSEREKQWSDDGVLKSETTYDSGNVSHEVHYKDGKINHVIDIYGRVYMSSCGRLHLQRNPFPRLTYLMPGLRYQQLPDQQLPNELFVGTWVTDSDRSLIIPFNVPPSQ